MAFNRVQYQEMKALIADMPANTTIIDVRENEEVQQAGVIGPSVNIPLSELKNAMKKTNDKNFQKKYGINKPGTNDELILYCLGESRAEKGAVIVQSMGYKNLKILEGGLEMWEQQEAKK